MYIPILMLMPLYQDRYLRARHIPRRSPQTARTALAVRPTGARP